MLTFIFYQYYLQISYIVIKFIARYEYSTQNTIFIWNYCDIPQHVKIYGLGKNVEGRVKEEEAACNSEDSEV